MPRVDEPKPFCVLDIETSGGNWSSLPAGFNLLMAGIREQNSYRVYTADPASLASLHHFLSSFQGSIVTFNGDHFDLPIINQYFNDVLEQTPASIGTHYDILSEIKKLVGHRISLDNLAKYTIGQEKISWNHRNNAQIWSTEPHRLVEYNRVDLDLTYELFLRVTRGESLFLGTSTIVLPKPSS